MSELLPTNIEAEEAILGGVLIDPGAIARIADSLIPEHFAINAHKVIYTAALDLHFDGKPTDLMTLSTWLSDRNKLEQIGGQSKLGQLVERTVSAVNIDGYAELVVDKFIRRELIHAANEISRLGYELSRPLDEVLEQSERLIFALNKLKLGQRKSTIKSSGKICSEILQDMEKILEDREQGIPTLPTFETGFYELDELDIFNPGNLIVVAGRPGMGKSAFGTNVCFHVANNFNDDDETSKKRVLMFNLEMTGKQVVGRELAARSGIPFRDIRQANLFEDRFERISSAIGRVGRSEFYIDESRNISVNQIVSRCKEFQASFGNLAFVCVDYLQLMIPSSDSENISAITASKINETVRQFKILAGELDVPIMLLSQLNRGVESRQDKRPMLSDLKGSGGIEEHPDGILFVFREAYYDEHCEDKNAAELIVAKARNAKVGTIHLRFDAAFTTFSNSYDTQRNMM